VQIQYARGGLTPCVRRRVHDYIATHLDQKITNDALAQIAGLSTAHFYAVFKQGMSPHRYVLQYRVRRTQQLTPGDYRHCLQDSAGSLYGKRACTARA
jgi:AraC-like DNA-binding protein